MLKVYLSPLAEKKLSHTSYFYRFNSDELEIITVFDNRQNPEKIEAEITKYFKSGSR